MIRFLLIAALILLSASLSSPTAQAQLAAAEAAANAQKPAEPPPAADPAQVKELVRTLNDPTARQKLIQQLTLLTQQQQAQKQDEAEPIGSRILKFLSAQVAEAGEEFGALGHSFRGLPAAERWFQRQAADPNARAHWIDLAGSLLTVLAGGAAALGLALLAMRGPRRSLEQHRPAGILSRLFVGLLRLVLRLIPVALFGFAGYSLLSMINAPAVVSLATLTIVNAAMLVAGVVAISRFLLAPRTASLRLVPFGDRAARFLHRWICWIGAIVAFGWFGITALRVLGLPKVAAHAALKLVALSILVILVGLVVTERKEIARWIRGSKGDERPSAFHSLRRRLSEVWHLLAIAYLVATFAVFAFDIEGGFDFILHGTLISVLVIAAARLSMHLVEHAVTRGTTLTHGAPEDRYSRLRERADIYLPIIRAGSSAIIWLIAVVVLVDVWGIDALDWATGPEGRAALARTLSIALIVISATVAWEFVSAVIETYLVGAVKDGTPVQRSQRVRTLLPLLRNAFLIFLIVVVVLIVLSELGLNIAPLLAGAGVVGLAIGFGAQTLVKDVITGMFILFENTVAVGDVVDLGGGHSGLVEHFSIRTIRLRDSNGGVHTVPFSNVTSVNNMTKDFAYYLFNIKVDYAIDSDRVVEAVTQLGAELQEDPGYKELILAPIEIIGLDSFGADAAILQARFKTKPIKQWSVGREFNRRLKKRFAELGIPQSFAQSMVILPGTGDATATENTAPRMPPKAGPRHPKRQEPK
ncbi:MAG TPA: mechanosensitive ion channel domain-containing protein [Alphaproteobacteria bacterium]|jgi:small conductance mechanosensitive channel|nr:mechanosensitive ion channel domain-containing protein [Alphaproteobacteria bacterium]